MWTLPAFVVCSYCGKDFELLGHYRWRCKKRLDNSTDPNGCVTITQERDLGFAKTCNVFKFSCEKECKGVKGLKMHQRKCRVKNENMDFDQQPGFENSNIESCDVANDNLETTVDGIKLPRSNDKLSEANNYLSHFIQISK